MEKETLFSCGKSRPLGLMPISRPDEKSRVQLHYDTLCWCCLSVVTLRTHQRLQPVSLPSETRISSTRLFLFIGWPRQRSCRGARDQLITAPLSPETTGDKGKQQGAPVLKARQKPEGHDFLWTLHGAAAAAVVPSLYQQGETKAPMLFQRDTDLITRRTETRQTRL